MVVVCVHVHLYVYTCVLVDEYIMLYVESYSLISYFHSKLEMFQLVNIYRYYGVQWTCYSSKVSVTMWN